MSAVSRTSSSVSNNWFKTSSTNGKNRRYRPRRSVEEQARYDAAKAEHSLASVVVNTGEWVVKGKRYNKLVKEPTPEEKVNDLRIKQAKDLKAIEKTISGAMSIIRQHKHKNSETKRGQKQTKPQIVFEKPKQRKSNSFSVLHVDSSDNEIEANANTESFEDDDFPVLGVVSSVKLPEKINYSFALKSNPIKQNKPVDFTKPPSLVKNCWVDQFDEKDEEDDYLPFQSGQKWGDFA